MIHAAPQVDFTGVLDVDSLEIGVAEINRRTIPAVRFQLAQNGNRYPILASEHLAAEIYAYCSVALEQGLGEIHVKIGGTLVVDIDGSVHVIVSYIAWYTSAGMREQAAASILHIFNGKEKGKFPTCAEPLIVVSSKRAERLEK